MANTSIEWTDKVWNPVTGCTKVSQGCKNCYAESMFHRFEKQWGEFTHVQTHQDRLIEPFKWKKPSKVFVNSMSDLFHEDVPELFIWLTFSVMASCPQHTFQVLTKRPERMQELFSKMKWKTKSLTYKSGKKEEILTMHCFDQNDPTKKQRITQKHPTRRIY